jgi:hypothetical protein
VRYDFEAKVFTNMFFRNMLADFGNRSADSSTPGKFSPYFRFKSLLANYWQKQKSRHLATLQVIEIKLPLLYSYRANFRRI